MSANPQISDKKQDAVIQFFISHPQSFGKKWVDSFDRSKDKYDWLKKNWSTLEEDEDWIEKFSSLSDFTKSKKQQLESTYKEYPHLGNLSQYRINNILSKSDFTEDEMRDYYEYRAAKDAAEAEKDQKKVQEATDRYMKLQRSRDDSYFNTPIANEYARKAYIEGTGDEWKQEILGKGASLFDWLPFVSLASPPMRQSQRIMSGEEPAEVGVPSWNTIRDYGSALAPDILERPGKLVLGALKSVANKVAGRGAAREIPVLTQIENRMNRNSGPVREARGDFIISGQDLDKMSDEQLINFYNATKDPELKASIKKYYDERMRFDTALRNKEKGDFGGNEALAKQFDEAAESARERMEVAARDFQEQHLNRTPEFELKGDMAQKDVFTDGKLNEHYSGVPMETVAEYVKSHNYGGASAALVEKALNISSPKITRTLAGGRFGDWDMIDPEADVKNYDLQRDIDLVIKTQSKNWKIDEKPADYDENPLVREAYDQWRVSPFKEWEYKSWRTE